MKTLQTFDFMDFGLGVNTPEALTNEEEYDRMRRYAYEKAKKLTFNRGYEDLKGTLNLR